MRARTSAPPKGAADVAPELLPILAPPLLDDVTDDQTRGATCVWCHTPLTTAMAVDLGEQMSPWQGSTSPMRWTPRACPKCTGERAHSALFAHSGTCGQCVDEAGGCEIGRGLYDLVRRFRR